MFYRNKGAYLVGLIRVKGQVFPFILPLLSTGQSIYVDTVIFEPELASIVFGFARAYFMVYAPCRRCSCCFCARSCPTSRTTRSTTPSVARSTARPSSIATISSTAQSREQFVIAPGIKGMVMSVFTLPSYDVVFKVIKDEFTPPRT